MSLDPVLVDAMVRLSSLAYRQSDWNTAVTLANRALIVRAGDYRALTTLANVAIAVGDLEKAEEILHRLKAAPSLHDEALANIALADLRHAKAQYAEAFAGYTAGNTKQISVFSQQFEHLEKSLTPYCNWLRAYFERASASRWLVPNHGAEAKADDPSDPVFLVGFPRSGTTLLENVLASHPQISTIEERDTLGTATAAFLTEETGLERLENLDREQIAEWRGDYWQRVKGFGFEDPHKTFVDKYPLSSMKLPLVAKFFPQAKILFAIRDPRDVVLSCFRRSFAMNTSMFEFLDLKRTAHFYDAVMRLAEVYRDKLGLDWREVRHESLIKNLESEMTSICGFIGLPWNDEMHQFAEHAKSRTIRTPSSVQVVRGLNSDGVGQWRNYRHELKPIMNIIQPWIEKFQFSPD
jgi:hypothetical protein